MALMWPFRERRRNEERDSPFKRRRYMKLIHRQSRAYRKGRFLITQTREVALQNRIDYRKKGWWANQYWILNGGTKRALRCNQRFMNFDKKPHQRSRFKTKPRALHNALMGRYWRKYS